MKRIWIEDTPAAIGQKVKVAGRIISLRSHGQLVFLDLSDLSGVIQVVGYRDLAKLKMEDMVEIVGLIKSRDKKNFNPKIVTGQIELAAEQFQILSKSADLPFDLHQPQLNVTLPTLLDYRPVSLRHSRIQHIFKVQETIVDTFRSYLKNQNFTEIFVPTIVSAATEGGSELFSLDYFGKKAYLSQSPQFYKQIMVPVFERVFTVAHAYRAEPSVTTRHLTEYVSLDVEMGFIDNWRELIKTADEVIKTLFRTVADKYADVLAEYNVKIPRTIRETPAITLQEAEEIIYKRTKREVRQEPDLDPEGEREIGRYAVEKFNSDLIFITHFPTSKRPMYTFPDPQNPELTLSFDLIGLGTEWITGGQRINDYEQLKRSIQQRGYNPDNFEIPYLQAFKYGMPPEGGFAIGLERITQGLLGLDNIRQASLFPRDMERIDSRLTNRTNEK
ncbi:MAG TPA: aspartate--tRNA(Asn) ligase [Candidatus Woesebacteria bacterium]|nr:aspartate--tRNA(Asn) ligase [Candidatus Woesebacteria bacterium]HRT39745.1 aspartate--tRNA(Asn) ligase [Candidatus Woesebacteria bacterium]